MTWNGVDMTSIITALAGIITALLGWAANSIRKRQEADAANTRAQTALLKLGAIAIAMAGRAWDKLSPAIQQAMADGKITAEERGAIEAEVQALLKDFTSSDDLAQIASALGIPLPGLVAKIAAMLIEKFAFAHDPGNVTVSAKAFPVTSGLPADDPGYQPG